MIAPLKHMITASTTYKASYEFACLESKCGIKVIL